ncbi:MAG: DUF6273 domain-containing protein [Defluviitaleaceae bacterium]|nr:DUF6273 domain-containing protein [Defluviitaleaceae bacterium]
MRNEIRQVLQDYQRDFGEEAIANPDIFNKRLQNTFQTPIHFLVNITIGRMDAYSRIKNSASRNMSTDVSSLSKELHKLYFIDAGVAKMVIESVAELLGYTSPNDYEETLGEVFLPQVGGTITFGDYDWCVLAVEEGKALLISEDILEQRAYHPCYAGVSWEESTLRHYLNNDFLNLFSQSDMEKILDTRLTNSSNKWYGIEGGNDTLDKIFILSLEEVDKYFGNSGDYENERRKKYDDGKWVSDDNGWILSNEHDSSRIAKYNGLASLWWVRSPGYSDCTVAYVSTTGNIPSNGDRVCIGRGGVRPALWVKI